MMMEYTKLIGMESLKDSLNIEKYDHRQAKVVKNIKWCSEDQWQWVNSYMDGDVSARDYFLRVRDLFDTIYADSQENLYNEGSVRFGASISSYLKDVRFCGKDFLQKVTLYYTANLLEEAVLDTECTEEEKEQVLQELLKIKNEVFKISKVSPENIETVMNIFNENLVDGNEAIQKIAEILQVSVKSTKKSEKWIPLDGITAEIFKNKFALNTNLVVGTSGQKTEIIKENTKFILKTGKSAYLWCVG